MLELLATLGAALRLEAPLFDDLQDIDVVTALGVLLVAALSSMFGHVAVLKLNRVSGWRLVGVLFINAIVLWSLQVVQAAVIWLGASLSLTRPISLRELAIVAMLAVSPQAFAFVTAMPHLGLGIGRLLEGWSYLILWYGTSRVFHIGWELSLAVTICGWLVMQLLSRLLARPLGAAMTKVWSFVIGNPVYITGRDILAGMPLIPVGHAQEVAR